MRAAIAQYRQRSAERRLPVTHEALVIHPGDTLIIRVGIGKGVDARQAQTVRNELMQRLPLLGDVMVITADELAVFRPDEVAQ